MKILYMTNFYPPPLAGTERHSIEMAEKMANRGHKVFLMYLPIAGRMLRPEKITKKLDRPPKGVRLIPIDGWTYLFKIFNYARIINPDIIHGHNFKTGTIAFFIGSLLGKKTVCSVHLSENESKGRVRKLSSILFRPFFRRMNFIAVSKDIADSIRKDIGKGTKVDVIYNWTWNEEKLKKADGNSFRRIVQEYYETGKWKGVSIYGQDLD